VPQLDWLRALAIEHLNLLRLMGQIEPRRVRSTRQRLHDRGLGRVHLCGRNRQQSPHFGAP
jgi:hypothetical protein